LSRQASDEDEPLWAVRVGQVVARLGEPLEREERDRVRVETWTLLNIALRRFLRSHAARAGGLDPSDIEDIASTKTLELLGRAESGAWTVHPDRGGREIAAYLSRIARNGLLDALRMRSRQVELVDEAERSTGAPTEDGARSSRSAATDALAESREFAKSLGECAGQLAPRSFAAWFLRVFHEMTSREIAMHPSVNATPAHVDVILQRARGSVSQCMQAKGHDTTDAPAGAFVELWRRFRLVAERDGWPVTEDAMPEGGR